MVAATTLSSMLDKRQFYSISRYLEGEKKAIMVLSEVMTVQRVYYVICDRPGRTEPTFRQGPGQEGS